MINGPLLSMRPDLNIAGPSVEELIIYHSLNRLSDPPLTSNGPSFMPGHGVPSLNDPFTYLTEDKCAFSFLFWELTQVVQFEIKKCNLSA
jgi:hypothetical protein